MGTFLTNVQVYMGEQDRESGRVSLIEAIQKQCTADGNLVLASSDEPADCSIVIGPASDAPWIAVYDQATESQDISLLENLVRGLSAPMVRPAVGVLLHDSDVLVLVLADGGRIHDRFVSDPDYWGRVRSRKAREKLAGQPDRWVKAFPWLSDQDLREAWNCRDSVFAAQAVLDRIGTLLHWTAEHACIGYNTLHDLAGATRLRFRTGPNSPMANRPPALAWLGWPEVIAWAGETGHFTIRAENTGKRSYGLSVVMWGPAIEDGVLSIQSVEMDDAPLWSDRASVKIQAELREERKEDGTRELDAVARDFPIRPVSQARLAGKMGWYDDFAAVIRFHADMPGKSTLNVVLLPHQDVDGQAGYILPVTIKPPPPLPLRATADPERYYSADCMQKPEVLFALVILDEAREEVLPTILDVFHHWHGIVCRGQKGAYHVIARPLTGPGIAEGRYAFRAGGKVPQKLLALLSASRQFIVSLLPLESGLAFDLAPGETDGTVPHLTLSAKLEGLQPEVIESMKECLSSLVDMLMRKGMVLQAVMGKWQSAPSPNESTLYESASGMSRIPTCRTTRRWCEQFLRAVTEAVWLGPLLAARVTRKLLSDVAAVEQIGTGMRATLSPGHTVQEMERALETVLPAPDDESNWQSTP